MKAVMIAGAMLTVAAPAMAQQAQDPHAGHAMGTMQGMDHSMHQMPADAEATAQVDHSGHGVAPATADEVGNAVPPPLPTDHPADAFWDKARMAKARAGFSQEGRFHGDALIADRLEYRPRNGKDGYAWQVMGWLGGDIDRLSFETEGEAAFGEPLETGEVRAAWRHAIDPWWNFELGVRQDFDAGPDRTYGVVGVEGLAPYWFEASVHAFVSNKGDVHFRLEAEHDIRLTQRLILQPSLEIDAAAQDVPELGIGAGLEKIELGARLRHEFSREFAPYLGLHWERKLGETARLAQADGEAPSQLSAVIGLRMWF